MTRRVGVALTRGVEVDDACVVAPFVGEGVAKGSSVGVCVGGSRVGIGACVGVATSAPVGS